MQSLKDIFEELIVVNGPTRFDLKNPSLTDGMSVSVEAFPVSCLYAQKAREQLSCFP